ncbi:MAG: LptF/LptG family permease, partial [Verrucomicrobiota bacterium]
MMKSLPIPKIEAKAGTSFRILALLVTGALAWAAHSMFQAFLEDQRALTVSESPGLVDPIPKSLFLAQVVAAGLSAFGLLVALIFAQRPAGQVVILSSLCLGLALAWLSRDLHYNLDRTSVSLVGEVPSVWTYHLQVVITLALILSPPLVLIGYHRSSLMDRYLLQGIMTPLTLCFAAFVSIIIIMDLMDNGKDFLVRGAGIGMLAYYYFVQLPQMIILVLPIILLLSLLFALAKMSQSNEIISMLGSGRSLYRIVRPVVLIGIFASLFSLVLNYSWAPQAEAKKKGMLNKLEDIKSGVVSKQSSRYEQFAAAAWMYSNSLDRRFWFVGRVPVDLEN